MVSGYFLWNNVHKIDRQIQKIGMLWIYIFLLYSLFHIVRGDFEFLHLFSWQTLLEILFLKNIPWDGVL